MRLHEIVALTREAQEEPQVSGWEFLGDGYQHYDTGAIVHIDFRALNADKPAKWDAEYWGEKLKGTLKKPADITSLLKKLAVEFPKIEDKAKKSLKPPAGWEFVGWAGSGDIEWTRKLPKDPGSLQATLTTFDVDEFMEGETVVFMLSVDDYGGYDRRNILEEKVKLNIKNYQSKVKGITRKVDKIEPLAVG